MMDTLSRDLTRSFFVDDNGHKALTQRWSRLVNSEERESLRAVHFLLYHAVRGKDWRTAFSPVTNATKQANGGLENWGLVHALRELRSERLRPQLLAPFEGILTPAALTILRDLLPAKASLETAYTPVKEVARAA